MDPDHALPGGRSPAGADPRAATPAELALVDAVLRKDRKAAAHLVAAHVDAVYSYVRHRLLPRADAVDDLVQDVFLAALSGLHAFQGSSSVRTWIIGIARHKVEDFYRRSLRSPGSLEELEAAGDAPATGEPALEDLIDDERSRARIRAVLAGLPERYSLILLWRYWEQRSIREIATETGTTEKAVERLLARARARFKQLWTAG